MPIDSLRLLEAMDNLEVLDELPTPAKDIFKEYVEDEHFIQSFRFLMKEDYILAIRFLEDRRREKLPSTKYKEKGSKIDVTSIQVRSARS